jgi:hypothetical protein
MALKDEAKNQCVCYHHDKWLQEQPEPTKRGAAKARRKKALCKLN